MDPLNDGPVSPLFQSLQIQPNITTDDLTTCILVSQELRNAIKSAPAGDCTCWGIPFHVNGFILVAEKPVSLQVNPVLTRWLVFMHASDIRPLPRDRYGLVVPPMRGEGQLNEHAADYVILYADGSEIRQSIRRRHQVGTFTRRWGDNCFQAVEASKPEPMHAAHEQLVAGWGESQTRNQGWDYGPWVNWLWAWENPNPQKPVIGIRFEPVSGVLILSGLAYGDARDCYARELAQ